MIPFNQERKIINVNKDSVISKSSGNNNIKSNRKIINVNKDSVISKSSGNNNIKSNRRSFPKSTMLIASDSMYQIEDRTTEQMKTKTNPMLQLQPDYVILHLGTNDSNHANIFWKN